MYNAFFRRWRWMPVAAILFASPFFVTAAEVRMDFGDAPDGSPMSMVPGSPLWSFPTALAHNGARVGRSDEIWLGKIVTQEADAKILGDDGDDGVGFHSDACKTSRLLIRLHIAQPGRTTGKAYVNAFFDWNSDGKWQGEDPCAAEWVVRNFEIDLAKQKEPVEVYAIDYPAGANINVWRRIILTKDETVMAEDGGGAFASGEVEDYGPALSPDAQIECIPDHLGILHGDSTDIMVVRKKGIASFNKIFASGVPADVTVSALPDRKGHFLVKSTNKHPIGATVNDTITFTAYYPSDDPADAGEKTAFVTCDLSVDHPSIFHPPPPPPDPPPPDPPIPPNPKKWPPFRIPKPKWIETKQGGSGEKPKEEPKNPFPFSATCGTTIVEHGRSADIEIVPLRGARQFSDANIVSVDMKAKPKDRELVKLPGVGRFRYWSQRRDGPARMEKDSFRVQLMYDKPDEVSTTIACPILIEHKDVPKPPPFYPPLPPEKIIETPVRPRITIENGTSYGITCSPDPLVLAHGQKGKVQIKPLPGTAPLTTKVEITAKTSLRNTAVAVGWTNTGPVMDVLDNNVDGPERWTQNLITVTAKYPVTRSDGSKTKVEVATVCHALIHHVPSGQQPPPGSPPEEQPKPEPIIEDKQGKIEKTTPSGSRTRLIMFSPVVITHANLVSACSLLQNTVSRVQGNYQRLSSAMSMGTNGVNPERVVMSGQLLSDIQGLSSPVSNMTNAAALTDATEVDLNEINGLLGWLEKVVEPETSQDQETQKAQQREIDKAIEAIDKIATDTSFGGRKVINGEFGYTMEGVNQDNKLYGSTVPQEIQRLIQDAQKTVRQYFGFHQSRMPSSRASAKSQIKRLQASSQRTENNLITAMGRGTREAQALLSRTEALMKKLPIMTTLPTPPSLTTPITEAPPAASEDPRIIPDLEPFTTPTGNIKDIFRVLFSIDDQVLAQKQINGIEVAVNQPSGTLANFASGGINLNASGLGVADWVCIMRDQTNWRCQGSGYMQPGKQQELIMYFSELITSPPNSMQIKLMHDNTVAGTYDIPRYVASSGGTMPSGSTFSGFGGGGGGFVFSR